MLVETAAAVVDFGHALGLAVTPKKPPTAEQQQEKRHVKSPLKEDSGIQ